MNYGLQLGGKLSLALVYLLQILNILLLDLTSHSRFVCGFGEPLQLDARIYDGVAEYHNHYPEEWAKVNQEAIDKAGCEEVIAYIMHSSGVF